MNPVTKKTFDLLINDQHDTALKDLDDAKEAESEDKKEVRNSVINSEYVPGLDDYEFSWRTDHPLRKFYNRMKKAMYSRYDCLSHENVDIRIVVDEILVLKTQLLGVGKLIRDGQGPKNLAFRVKEQQKNLRENIQLLMKYTRTEPEKKISKKIESKGKELAGKLREKLTETQRANLMKHVRETVQSRHVSDTETDSAPFGEDEGEDK